ASPSAAAGDQAFRPGAIGPDGLPLSEPGRGSRRPAAFGLPGAPAAATEVFAAAEGVGREPGRPAVRRTTMMGRRAGATTASEVGPLGSGPVPPGSGPVPAGSVPPPVAAWPAGAPASRFMDGPPPSSRYLDGPPGTRPRSDSRGLEPGRPAAPTRSPSGTPYDEPESGQGLTDGWDGYPAPPAGQRPGSAAPYQSAPDYEPADYPGSPAGHVRPGGGYPADASRDAYPGQPGQAGPAARSLGGRTGYPEDAGYGGPSGYPQDAGYGGPSGYPVADADYGGRAGYDEVPDRHRHRHRPGRAPDRHGEGSDPRAPEWPAGQQHGWPQEYAQGWPQPAGPGPAWQPRPGEELDPLGPLPPAGELHHDGRAGRGRSARAWPAPDDDDEGDTW
ncbi:MAG: hypothetical protein WBH47_18220, partial [Streptosporangiaceae bacterium]